MGRRGHRDLLQDRAVAVCGHLADGMRLTVDEAEPDIYLAVGLETRGAQSDRVAGLAADGRNTNGANLGSAFGQLDLLTLGNSVGVGDVRVSLEQAGQRDFVHGSDAAQRVTRLDDVDRTTHDR